MNKVVLRNVIDTRNDRFYSIAIVYEKDAKYFIQAFRKEGEEDV